jgi:hypothetical protein
MARGSRSDSSLPGGSYRATSTQMSSSRLLIQALPLETTCGPGSARCGAAFYSGRVDAITALPSDRQLKGALPAGEFKRRCSTGSGIIPSGPNSLKGSYALVLDGDRRKHAGGRV